MQSFTKTGSYAPARLPARCSFWYYTADMESSCRNFNTRISLKKDQTGSLGFWAYRFCIRPASVVIHDWCGRSREATGTITKSYKKTAYIYISLKTHNQIKDHRQPNAGRRATAIVASLNQTWEENISQALPVGITDMVIRFYSGLLFGVFWAWCKK